MKPSEKKDDSENLFQIMEGIISQINKTKKTFVTLLIAHLIIVPIAFAVTFALFGPPFPMGGPWNHGADTWNGQPSSIVRIIPILVVLVWLGFGIRQWLAFSKWTRKFEIYKEVQKKLNEKLGYDDEESEDGEHEKKP